MELLFLRGGLLYFQRKLHICPEDAAKILFSIAIGLLMQGLLNPQGADWGNLVKKSFGLLLK